MTAAASPATRIAFIARCRSGASGVVAWASLAVCTPPIRVAAVPVMPVAMPAASSAATARNEVVVLPSVPVIPTTARASLGSSYHQAAALARADRTSPTTSCATGDVRDRSFHEHCRGSGLAPRPRRSHGRRHGARGRPRTASRRGPSANRW